MSRLLLFHLITILEINIFAAVYARYDSINPESQKNTET